jgi:uncharacterized protein YaiL (DUF2058 family)
MLSTLTTSKKAIPNSADTTLSKMMTQEQHGKTTRADREKIARRQRLSEEAHIKRNRDKVAQQERAANIKRQLKGRSTEADKVSIEQGIPAYKNANKVQ